MGFSRYARALATAAHLLLMAGLAWWSSSTVSLLLTALLLLPLPGLLRGREYTYAWSSLLLSIYCAGLLAEAFAIAAHRPVALALAGVAAAEFSALVLYVRLRQRERSAQTAGSAGASR